MEGARAAAAAGLVAAALLLVPAPSAAADPVPGAPLVPDSGAAQGLPTPSDVVVGVGRHEAVDVVALERTESGVAVSSEPAVGRAEARAHVSDALADPGVLAVAVDSPVRRLGGADPRLPEQWGMSLLDVSSAWQVSTGAGAVVAVLDSGVDRTHPDLAGAVLPGINTRTERGDQTMPDADSNGHGTHVAGVIAARAGNGIGGAGVAPDAQILPVKVLDRFGGGWVSDVVEGIVWAVDNGADVINLSLGGEESELIGAAVDQATAAGVVVVAAAGNDASDVPSYPAALDGVLSVTAIGTDGRPAGYANRGATVDLQAPGDGILSTIPGGYGPMTGTSMAAPFVAGAAALVRSARPDADAAQILLTSARANPRAGQGFGVGIIDPAAALGVGCTGVCPLALPAADEAAEALMRQSIDPPVRVRIGRAKDLPAATDIGVRVKRWRALTKRRCSVGRDGASDSWTVVGQRRGWCRLRVKVPPAEGFRSLRTTVRMRVVALH